MGVAGFEANVSKVSLSTGPKDFTGVLIPCRRPEIGLNQST